ncbi:LmeA family phospholipid-binding protein [Catenuloplanes atrovinosus]|uniref:DUF2993 domain-containing protein n=1 Tax=Catenuloplanes atrovinosus TaxID=137266 RepID=A0AAE4CCS0_9ACTN|nr:DUF2993 domain-containing protein [Catenuloplanes atrovinosus]MDR7276810.1 hypothetical protein [Catenuloplanes atrovinosus]
MPKRQWIVAGALVAALAVPVAVDRTVAAVAENRVAALLSCATGATGDLDVTIGGFPFLTQLVRGAFDQVRLRADAVTVRDVALHDIDIEAHGLRGTSVDSLTATGVLAWSGLGSVVTERLGAGGLNTGGLNIGALELGGDDAGRLAVTAALPIAGTSVPATVYADLAVAGTTLTITPAEVELSALGLRVPASRLPSALAGPHTVPLPALPAGLVLQRVAATADGLAVTVAGTGMSADGIGTPHTDTTGTCEGTNE